MTGRGARVRAGALSMSAKKGAAVQSVTAKKPPNAGKLFQDSHAVAIEDCYNCVAANHVGAPGPQTGERASLGT